MYMADPVMTVDGHTYEREAIEKWFAQGHRNSHKTGLPLRRSTLVPCHGLRSAIEEYVETVPEGERPERPGPEALRRLHERLEDSFRCPITMMYMADPVMTVDGHTYEREAIENWFARGHRKSPKTGLPLRSPGLVPCHALRSAIEEYVLTVPEGERPERPEPEAPVPMEVEVADAGDAEVNGLFARKDAAQGPPRRWNDNMGRHSLRVWAEHNTGRYYYEKDDGCFLYRFGQNPRGVWFICAPGRHTYYNAPSASDDPPAEGWRLNGNLIPRADRAPAPTIRVVD